jgi:hypothetical protein
MLPPFLVAAEVQKDLTLFEQLDEFVALSNQLHEKLRDTQMLAGSEAYSVCLKAYDAFMNAADSGVPGADAVYQHLKTRFAQRGGNNNHSTPPVI